MNIKKLIVALVTMVGLSMSGTLVFAQSTDGAAEPRPEDNWLKVCEPLENGESACIMRQVVVRNNQFLGSFSQWLCKLHPL